MVAVGGQRQEFACGGFKKCINSMNRGKIKTHEEWEGENKTGVTKETQKQGGGTTPTSEQRGTMKLTNRGGGMNKTQK